MLAPSATTASGKRTTPLHRVGLGREKRGSKPVAAFARIVRGALALSGNRCPTWVRRRVRRPVGYSKQTKQELMLGRAKPLRSGSAERVALGRWKSGIKKTQVVVGQRQPLQVCHARRPWPRPGEAEESRPVAVRVRHDWSCLEESLRTSEKGGDRTSSVRAKPL